MRHNIASCVTHAKGKLLKSSNKEVQRLLHISYPGLVTHGLQEQQQLRSHGRTKKPFSKQATIKTLKTVNRLLPDEKGQLLVFLLFVFLKHKVQVLY